MRCLLVLFVILPQILFCKDTTRFDHSARIIELDFFSNSTYLGKNSLQKFPYLSLFYLEENKKGWWISPTVTHLFNAGHAIDEVNIAGGKDFRFAKKGEGSVSYTRYIFHPESPTIRSGLRNNAEVLLARRGWLYTSAAADLNFGNTGTDFFMIFEAAKAFYKDDIFKKEIDFIRFRPKLSLIAGTTEIYEDFIIKGQGGNGKGKGTKTGKNQVVTGSSTVFRLTSFQLGLPLRYTYRKWSAQFSYILSVPFNRTAEESSISYFSCSTWINLK